MTAKKSKKSKKLENAKAIVKKINNDLIDASFNAIETTVKTGEKWQQLTSKLIKKAEPLSKQQINMVVDTAETIKGQLEQSTDRLKNLVGYDPKMIEQAKRMVAGHPLTQKAEETAEKIKKEVAKNPLVKKAEKMADRLKKELNETIEDVKDKVEDVTEDVKEKVEDVVEDVQEKVGKALKTETKKAPAKKKAAPKKPAAKKTAAKKAPVKNDLKVIKGIGPKMETILNAAGITSYADVAKATLKNVEKILTDAGMNTKMYNPAQWKEQAKELIKK